MRTPPAVIIWWKEIRAVLPLWLVAIVALMLPTLLGGSLLGIFPRTWHEFGFVIGSVAVASWLFSREFQDQTLLWQLVQPQRRGALLWRKLMLAACLQLPLAVVFLVVDLGNWGNPDQAVQFCIVGSTVALASACFWSPVLKHTMAVLVIALVTPYLFAFLTYGLLEWVALQWYVEWVLTLDYPQAQNRVMVGLFGIYALGTAGGSFLFWRNLQLKGVGPAISGFEVALSDAVLGVRRYVKRPAWLALLRKEVGLLRHCFWLGAIFFAAALAFAGADFVVMKLFVPETGIDQPPLVPAWWLNAGSFAVAMFFLQLALVPVLSGALVFAEEKQLGNFAWQLCQPVSGWWRWWTKLTMALAVSIGMGLLLPGAVAWGYDLLGVGDTFIPRFDRSAMVQAFVMHGLLFSVAAWCGTWSQNAVSAIVKVFLVLVLFLILHTQLAAPFTTHLVVNGTLHRETPDWRWSALALTTAMLLVSLVNYRQLTVGLRQWLGQSALFACVVIITFFVGMHF